MARIELVDLEKRFPDGTVGVASVSLSVEDRELLVLVGPSGCGKSTVLRMLAGLETATSGTIRIGDRVVNDVPPQQRNVAMVFQDYALYPHMTVRKNLEFPLKMRRMARDEMSAQVDRVAGLLEIQTLLDRLPKQLSGGQRQRVAMGRALVREPAASLLDEPLSNLDPRLRVQVRAEIQELQAKTGTTMIYVTHDQVEAMSLGHRVAVMNEGRLQQVDTPRALYADPANVMVAGFIGNPPMNLLPAKLLGVDGETAGVRPEHVAIAKDAGGLRATVQHVEELGHESLAHLRVDGVETQIVARLPGMPDVEAGRQVGLTIDPAHVRVFDGDGRLVR
jgi:ABC-type sugar transport system ATPase subunit